MPQKDQQAKDRGRKERSRKDEERGGGARQTGGRRAASEGGEGSEEARRLRWRINQLEKEKVALTASHNQEVCGLQAELARLRSSLERGEAQRAELQYQLTVSRRDGERAAERSGDQEALAGRLQQTVEELQTALHITRRARDEDQHALQLELEERDRLVQSLDSESQRLHSLLQEQKEVLQESERRIMEVETQRQREAEENQQRAQELEVLMGREGRIQREKEESDRRVKALEAALEAERAAHLESKFSCEVMQLQLRDLEAALAAERSGQQEARRGVELLRVQLAEAERACSLQRERSDGTERALQRLQDERRQDQAALNVAMETEKAARCELKAEKRKLASSQALLEQALQRQAEAEEAFTQLLKEITDILLRHRTTAQPTEDAGKLSPAELLPLVESTICSLQLSVEEAQKEVQDLLQASGRLQQEKEDLLLLTSNQKNNLDEYQQLCGQLQEEVTCLRQQGCDWSMQLQGLQEELQREKEERRAEMLKISESRQQEAEDRLAFLHCLYQRLLAGCVLLDQPQSILGDFTWEELCDVISEQAEQLTSDLQKADIQRAELQTLCEQRSLRLRDLQRSQEAMLTQLEERLRRREEAWRRRHKHTQSRLQLCRSECDALRDHASSLERRCCSLTSDLYRLQSLLSRGQQESCSSLLAAALLSGALKHAHRRLGALSEQKTLLCRRLGEKEQLEREVRRLAEALGGEEEEEGGAGRALRRRRWRRTVCALLAARRWSLLARKTQVVLRVERGGATVCVCAESTASAKGQDCPQTDKDGVLARWLQSEKLLSAVLSSMADLRGALTHTGSSPPVLIPAARSSVSRLLDHLFGQSASSDPSTGDQNALSDCLRQPTSTQPDMKALVSTLQQHFLLFSQRLHSAEVERRSLRLEVANLKRGLRRETEAASKTVSAQHFHSVWAELRQALSREHEAQTLIQEQTNQMRAVQQTTQELSEVRREVSRKERTLRILGNHLSEVQRQKRQLEERLQRAEDELRDASRCREGFIHCMKAAETDCKQVRESLLQSQHSLTAKPRLFMMQKGQTELGGAESIMGASERSVCQNFLSALSQLCLTCSSRVEWLQQEVSAHRSHVTALRGELQDACLRESLAFVPFPGTSNFSDVERLSPKRSRDSPNLFRTSPALSPSPHTTQLDGNAGEENAKGKKRTCDTQREETSGFHADVEIMQTRQRL